MSDSIVDSGSRVGDMANEFKEVYLVLRHNDTLALAEAVTVYMRDGWTCQGGVCAVYHGGWNFYQAMVKS